MPSHRMSAAERQRQLIEVALNAFSRRGFKGTTTKEIAAAAGVAEAIIFQHFPTKETLYSAVLDLHLDAAEEEQWIADIGACMERKDDEAVFLSFMLRTLHSYRCHPLFERVVLFAALEGHEQGMARMQKQFSPLLERLVAYVTRRQHEGALIKCDPHAILIAAGGVAHQYGLITQIFRAPIPDIADEEMARIFVRILLHGVRPNPALNNNNRKKAKPAKQRNRKAKE